MFQLKRLVGVVLGLVVVTGCGSKNKSSSPVATAPATYYIGNGGLCYNSSNTQVDMSLCNQYNNLNNNQYVLNGQGVCVLRSNPAQIAPNSSYCSSIGQYTFNGAYCIDRNTGAQVSVTLCNSTYNQYYSQGTICIDRNSGQQVPFTYCSSGQYTGSCVGTYYYYAYDSYYDEDVIITTICSGADCAGYGLYEAATNQYRYCQ